MWDLDILTCAQLEPSVPGLPNADTETCCQEIPPFISDDTQWRTLFSSLLKIMGDVNQRMQQIEKSMDGLHSRLDQVELSVKNSNVSSLPSKQTRK